MLPSILRKHMLVLLTRTALAIAAPAINASIKHFGMHYPLIKRNNTYVPASVMLCVNAKMAIV